MRRLTRAAAGRLGAERGAIAVFVALAMTMLLAFAAFAIGAATVYRDRQLARNGADAAALAVALECASVGTCPADPLAVATDLVRANLGPDATAAVTLADRSVTVTATVPSDNLIWQLFQQGSDTVTMTATAVWEPATVSFPAAHPLALSYCRHLQLPGQEVGQLGALVILPPRQDITPADWTGNESCTGPDGTPLIGPTSVMTPTDEGEECGTTSAKGREVTGETFQEVAFDDRVCVASAQFGAADSWLHGGYEIVLPIYDRVDGDRYRVWDHLGFHVMGTTDRGGVWGFSTGLVDPVLGTEVPFSVRLAPDP